MSCCGSRTALIMRLIMTRMLAEVLGEFGLSDPVEEAQRSVPDVPEDREVRLTFPCSPTMRGSGPECGC